MLSGSEFEVARASRSCAATGRELRDGERFFSALVPAGAQLERRDYSPEGWTGPPAEALAWWQATMPSRSARRARLAPNDVLLELFEELAARPEVQDQRYVLALLLVRRRVLRLEENIAAGGQDVCRLFCPRNEQTYEVPVAVPDAERAQEIQDELARLLYASAE